MPSHRCGCTCVQPFTGPTHPQDKKNQDASEGGQRVVTALMYLSTPEEGGETVFPDAEVQTLHPGGVPSSPCAARGLVNKAYRGDMIM
jgi:prolyl 4-hydroxylase